MVELASSRDEALARVRLRWDDARTEASLSGVHGRLRRARARRIAAAATLSGAMIAVAAGFILAPSGSGRAPVANVPSAIEGKPFEAKELRFVDGSAVQLFGRESSVRVIQVTPGRIEVELEQGGGRFRVTPDPDRHFVVRSGRVAVEVVGTEFIVERRADQSRVEVVEGRVRVSWVGGSAVLDPGGEGSFPTMSRGVTGHGSSTPTAPAKPPEPAKTASPTARYQELARRRDYAEAFRILSSSPNVVGQSAAELMLAADVARLSGHPSEAMPFLRQVIDRHPSSSQAPLAAFTLGRMLSGMGRSGEAMQAFAEVRRLAPSSPLAEDALAREVELAHRSGNQALARRLAEQYLRTYPKSPRAATIREQGGLL